MDARTVFAWVLVAVSVVILWLLVQPFLSWLLVTGLLAVALEPVHRRLEKHTPTVLGGLWLPRPVARGGR